MSGHPLTVIHRCRHRGVRGGDEASGGGGGGGGGGGARPRPPPPPPPPPPSASARDGRGRHETVQVVPLSVKLEGFGFEPVKLPLNPMSAEPPAAIVPFHGAFVTVTA